MFVRSIATKQVHLNASDNYWLEDRMDRVAPTFREHYIFLISNGMRGDHSEGRRPGSEGIPKSEI
jgi:hypothetical protein